jgi:dolichol-phosphate mannosyltransferase
MPAFNEAAGIEAAVREVLATVTAVESVEVIVVDDGSGDGTGEILDELAREHEGLRVVHQANAGHGAALRTGIEAARGERLFLLDADRQIPLTAFPAVWSRAGGRDGAFGVRAVREDPPVRRALTWLVRLAIAALFGLRIADANAPFKVVRREVWREAARCIPRGTLAPSLFLAIYVRHRGLDVPDVEVPHRARATGAGSLPTLRLAKFCIRALGQLLALRARLGRCASTPSS